MVLTGVEVVEGFGKRGFHSVVSGAVDQWSGEIAAVERVADRH